MAKKELITRVWIEEGCIVCDACETASPEVFEVQEETCVIRPGALDAEFTKARTDSIADAAEECPVDVIKFETAPFEVPDEAAEAVADTGDGSTAKAPEPAPVATSSAQVGAKDDDATLQALLKAATIRGGAAGIERTSAVLPEEIARWRDVSPLKLPPDIRHARAMEAMAKATARVERTDKQKVDPSRRTAISSIALGCGWACFGAAAAVSTGPALMRFMMPNVLEEPDPRVRVGSKDKYAEMVPNQVNEDFKPQGVWMVRQEGYVAALNIICTHLGCIPNWLPNDRKFKCPCHGSGFKPNGVNFEGPAPRPLERFKITEVDGRVVVDKSKKFQYERGEWTHPDSFVPV